MKNTTKTLIAGSLMLGSLAVSTAAASASGTPHSGIYLTNPDPNWYQQHPMNLPPQSQWGRIDGQMVAVNPALKNNFAWKWGDRGSSPVQIGGLMQWMPDDIGIGSYTKPSLGWIWAWYPTWSGPIHQVSVSANGSFSVKVPPGRYSVSFYVPKGIRNAYNGQPNGGGDGLGASYADPHGMPLPPTPYMFVVKPGQTVHLVPTRIFSTEISGYHAHVSGARSQLDLFGLGFSAASVVTSDAPGVTFTKPIFTGYMGSWEDLRLRTTVVMGPGTQAGTYLLTVKSPTGTATTTMTIYKAPGSKVFSARFGTNFNYAQN